MAERSKKINRKKQIIIIELSLLILLVAAIAMFAVWVVKFRKVEPPRTDFSSLVNTSSAIAAIPDDAANAELLSESFTYDVIDSSAKNSGLLYVGEDMPKVSKGRLQPVYNAVFDRSGLQIASVNSSDMRCRSEIVMPLNAMLCGFYEETGLRTVMIERAYDADSASSDSDYDYEDEEDYDDGGFYDPFGNYLTFGFTDEYGSYYGDGYYDSYGNYMGYGYYDDDGNYIAYEDIEAANGYDSADDGDSSVNESVCAEHGDGFSVDLGLYFKESGKSGAFDGSGDYAWFTENCWKYGFTLRYPDGKEDITGFAAHPAHFRYVGRTAAKVLHDNDICLEELSGFMRAYNYDSPLTVNSLDGTAIFYSIDDPGLDSISIQIPEDSEGTALEYTVSDTGDERYIITVLLTDEFTIKSGGSSGSENGGESPDNSADVSLDSDNDTAPDVVSDITE